MISLLTSVLIRAYINKDYVGVERLIKLGADINTQDEYGYTMLMYAAITCDVEAVELLIKLGANVDVKDEYGYTALDLAHKFTQIKIINLLNIYKKMKITNRVATIIENNYITTEQAHLLLLKASDAYSAAEDYAAAYKVWKNAIKALDDAIKALDDAEIKQIDNINFKKGT